MFIKCCMEVWEEKKIWNFVVKEMYIGVYYDIKLEFRFFGYFIFKIFWGGILLLFKFFIDLE